MSLNLQPGDLKLPFADGTIYRITSLFNDPRRDTEGWDPKQRGYGKHEGIDWAIPKDTDIHPMVSGTVKEIFNTATIIDPDSSKEQQAEDRERAKKDNFGYGNAVTVQSVIGDTTFSVTYAHLHEVHVEEKQEVGQDTILGTCGSTGNSAGYHLHVHLILSDTTESPEGFLRPYRNFQAGLPEGHYIWPDIEALRDAPAPTGTVQATITDRAARYPVLAKDAATAAWYRIRFSGSIRGWVQAACVQLHGDGRNLPLAAVPTTDDRPRLSLASTTTAGLNLRTGPGEGHRILLTLPFNATRYDIVGKDADPAGWYEIRFSATVTGWVAAAHVQTHGNLAGLEATWNPTPRLRLKAATTLGLNVRSGPDRAHSRIGFIKGGSTVEYEILGRNAATATWWQIRYSPTVPGWVSADHVQTRGDLTGLRVTWSADPQLNVKGTNTIDLNVRTGPDAGHDRIGSIAVGSTIRYDILGKDAPTATWYRIRFGAGVDGWVSAQWVRTHCDLGGLPVTWNPGPQLSLKPTTTSNLNVRTGPGADHAWLGRIPGGSTARYDILARSAAPPTWYQIRFSDTVTGWVHGDYVQIHGSLVGLPVR